MEQITNRTKYKNSKIQTRQNTKGHNTKCQITNVTKYKWNEIQIEQNAKIPTYKHNKDKVQQTHTCVSA